jgi:hypothetical protein
MKDLREIKLTRPRLIKIRNNFRLLWKAAVEEKISKYHHKMAEVETASEEWDKLREKRTDLAKARNYSIIGCGMCAQRTGDRIWVAFRKKWYCLNCYRKYVKSMLRRELRQKGRIRDKNQKRIFDY